MGKRVIIAAKWTAGALLTLLGAAVIYGTGVTSLPVTGAFGNSVVKSDSTFWVCGKTAGCTATSDWTQIAAGAGGGASTTNGYLTTAAAADLSGENVVAPTANAVIVANGTVYNPVVVPSVTAGQHLTFDTAAHTFGVSNDPLQVVTLGSDVGSSAATTYQNVTGLSFAVTSGKTYTFRAVILYDTSVATIGLRVAVTTPTITRLAYTTMVPQSSGGAATSSAAAPTEWINSATTTDAGVTSTASISTTSGNVIYLDGVYTAGANGTLQVRFAPETATANGIVIKAGSALWYSSN